MVITIKIIQRPIISKMRKEHREALNIRLVMEIYSSQHLLYKLNYKQITTDIKMSICVNNALKRRKKFKRN